MTLLSDFQKNLSAPKLKQRESDREYKTHQNDILERQTKFIDPIIDMRKQLELVRQNKSTLSQSLVSGTTSRNYK